MPDRRQISAFLGRTAVKGDGSGPDTPLSRAFPDSEAVRSREDRKDWYRSPVVKGLVPELDID